MTRSSFRSPSEYSRLSCRARMVSLVVFVTLFVTACLGVGTMINCWS